MIVVSGLAFDEVTNEGAIDSKLRSGAPQPVFFSRPMSEAGERRRCRQRLSTAGLRSKVLPLGKQVAVQIVPAHRRLGVLGATSMSSSG